MAINKQNDRHTTPPQTHIAFIMLRPNGIGSRQEIVTVNNQGRQRTTPCDKRCFNCKDSHFKRSKVVVLMNYDKRDLDSGIIK